MERATTVELKPFLLAWLICLLLMEFFGAGVSSGPVYKQFDYRAFYSAGYIARTHPSQLYNLAKQEQVQQTLISEQGFLPFYHPSYEALLYVPFSFLSYRAAYLFYIIFNLALLLAAFLVARPALSSVVPGLQSQPGIMLLIFLPLLISVVHGQDSILFLLLCCLTWKSIESGNDATAGFFLALALFKFQIAVPIAALIGIRRGWRFSANFVCASAGVVLACIAIVGISGAESYVRLLSGAISAIDKGAIAQHGMNVMPSAMTNLAGLLYGFGARLLRSSMVFNILVNTCALGLFIWCASTVRRVAEEVAFSLAILCGVLVSYHLFIYDLTLVLLPVALLAGRTHRFILWALYLLPVLLLPFGAKWFFPTAAPVLAITIYTLATPQYALRPIPAPPRAATV